MGSFQGEHYDSDLPPPKLFANNGSCKSFTQFIRKTLLARLRSGAISLVGRVGSVTPPHLVLPLTVEPGKPRLCHDARFLNLWMEDKPFTLDRLGDLPRYVSQDSYQTVLDDKSGYDHIFLSEDSRTFVGFQWGGWYFTYNTLLFGWKISPFVYHTTGLLPTHFFRSIGIPCSLYIDDRHNGQLQTSLAAGEYASLQTQDERRFAAAESAVFLVAFYLLRLGYFLGLSKSILVPVKVVPYLGYLSNSTRQVFQLIPEKRFRFLELVGDVLTKTKIGVKTLQRLAGKCIAFSLSVPAALLFTREMHLAISAAARSHRLITVTGALKQEISHWLFLDSWDHPIPWGDERHFRVSVATDASASGWAGSILSPITQEISDYCDSDQSTWNIASKEAMAINQLLRACGDIFRNAWVDAQVDNQAVIHAWNNQGGRSSSLNNILKRLFFTTAELNICLRLVYVSTKANPADLPSRRLSLSDSRLTDTIWTVVQRVFGGPGGHTCDLMALQSNAMRDSSGRRLPFFSPWPSPGALGVNLFAQDLSRYPSVIMQRPYVFPPLLLVGPVLRFLQHYSQSCTIVVLDVYPLRYWWPLLMQRASRSLKLADQSHPHALLRPSQHGWLPHSDLKGDLWAFSIEF